MVNIYLHCVVLPRLILWKNDSLFPGAGSGDMFALPGSWASPSPLMGVNATLVVGVSSAPWPFAKQLKHWSGFNAQFVSRGWLRLGEIVFFVMLVRLCSRVRDVRPRSFCPPREVWFRCFPWVMWSFPILLIWFGWICAAVCVCVCFNTMSH